MHRFSLRFTFVLFAFIIFIAPIAFAGAAEQSSENTPKIEHPLQTPAAKPIPVRMEKPIFSEGIVLGGDVECTEDGILRFRDKQLQLCVGKAWHVVILQQ